MATIAELTDEQFREMWDKHGCPFICFCKKEMKDKKLTYRQVLEMPTIKEDYAWWLTTSASLDDWRTHAIPKKT